VSVESTDETTARARELGASVLIEPRDIGAPDALVGRMALLADPQGARPTWRQRSTSAVRRAQELAGEVVVLPTATVPGDIAVVHDPAGRRIRPLRPRDRALAPAQAELQHHARVIGRP
jgi:hypothetical protein